MTNTDDRSTPRPTAAEASLIAAHTRIAEQTLLGMQEFRREVRKVEGFGISQAAAA